MGELRFEDEFNSRFHQYKDQRVAVYGTGDNARLIAEFITGYHIIGFITKNPEQESVFGKLLLSIDEAIKKADVIIIAATPSSTNIVYTRIKDRVPLQIPILDFYGNVMNKREKYQEDSYWDKTFEQLCEEIDKHEVISFDVFDTLIMRDVLRPVDIFGLTAKMTDGKETPEGWQKIRVLAEKMCRTEKDEPFLKDIYEYASRHFNIDCQTADKLRKKEWELEKRFILQRKKMIDAYWYALDRHKKVILTSDMYLTETEIRELLSICGINNDVPLLVSSEEKVSKEGGHLYKIIKEKYPLESILHIGDDSKIDGYMAEKQKIDSFIIRSSYDLLAASPFAEIFDYLETDADKFYLGYFISRILNDPFALGETKGLLPLTSARDIALVIYPMTQMYLEFICENAKRYDCILFPSRDGYLPYLLYAERQKKEEGLPDAKYVYASRMALSRAALTDEESFKVLLSKLISDQSQNCKNYIYNQFGYRLPDEFDNTSGELIRLWGKDRLLKRLYSYFTDICNSIQKCRENYSKYIDSVCLRKYASFAAVDVVSYGTQIYCFSKILNKKVDMLALGTTSVPNAYVKNTSVYSVYGNVNLENDGIVYSVSELSILHLFLEMLYSSGDGQFLEITEDMSPAFLKGTEYDVELLKETQSEIIKIADQMEKLDLSDKRYSKGFSFALLRSLLGKFSCMETKLKEKLKFSDPYAGRSTVTNLAKMI